MRSYGQFCALARSLDLLGERWTLLVVRELLLGPQRFSDLLAALPGIGPNLLTRRLRMLEREGVVRRALLAPPAAARVYELTERGRALEHPLLALTSWGVDPIAPPDPRDRMQPQWYVIALWAAYRPQAVAGAGDEGYQFEIDGVPFHLERRDGQARARRGPVSRPAFTLRASLADFLAIVTGAREPTRLELEGNRAAFGRFLTAHALPAPRSN